MINNLFQQRVAKKKLTELSGYFPNPEVRQIREVTTLDAKEFVKKGKVWLSDVYKPNIFVVISAMEEDFGKQLLSSHIGAWATGAPCYIYYIDTNK